MCSVRWPVAECGILLGLRRIVVLLGVLTCATSPTMDGHPRTLRLITAIRDGMTEGRGERADSLWLAESGWGVNPIANGLVNGNPFD